MVMFNFIRRRKAQQTIRDLNAKIEAVQDLGIKELRNAIDKHDAWVLDNLNRSKKRFSDLKHDALSIEYFHAQRDVNRWTRMVESVK